MTLARWQATIVDAAGNVLPAAQITVRREIAGAPLASIYADRAGGVAIGNPFPADSEGFAAFHAPGGAYRITATSGAFSRTWRYVGIGLASEGDAPPLGVSYILAAATADADPGPGLFRLNHATPASATQITFDNADADGIAQTAWLDSFDDGGSPADRGVIILRSADLAALLVARVTGSAVDGAGYRKLSITVLSAAAAATFVAGTAFGVSFSRAGTDGSGDVSGPASSLDNELAQFAGTSGDQIEGSGKTINTVGAGKQSIWIPAGALVLRGGTSSYSVLATNQLVGGVVSYDAAVFEDGFFDVKMPKGWDVGSFTFRAVWSHAATAGNFGVTWHLAAVPLSNGDLLTTAIADAVLIADTGGTTDALYISDESPVLTLATPASAAQDTIRFRIARLVSDAGDAMAIDARLHGLMLHFFTNANTDA